MSKRYETIIGTLYHIFVPYGILRWLRKGTYRAKSRMASSPALSANRYFSVSRKGHEPKYSIRVKPYWYYVSEESKIRPSNTPKYKIITKLHENTPVYSRRTNRATEFGFVSSTTTGSVAFQKPNSEYEGVEKKLICRIKFQA